MSRRADQADSPREDVPPRRDRGSTFIELLISIVLIGTAVITILTAVRATVIASTVSRDHAKAHQWLQSGIGVLQAAPFAKCSDPADGSDVQAAYQADVDANAERPEGFGAATITVGVPRIWFQEDAQYKDFNQQSKCYDDNRVRQQLVEIVVVGPDGKIVESIEVVKRDG